MRTIFRRRGSGGRIRSAFSSWRTSPGAAAARSRAKRPSRSRARSAARAAASAHQQTLQRRAQRGRVDVARDLALAHEGHHAVLLGDDDRERIGLLGEPDGGAVAGAERLRDGGIGGERQEAAGRGDAPLLDDEGAVVDRRAGHEDARHQLLGDLRVEARADLDVLVQPDLVLQHDEGPDPAGGHGSHALHQLLDRLALRDAVGGGEERARAHLRERAPDVVLEDDEDEDERPAEQVLEEHVDGVDLEPPGGEVDAVEHPEPDQHGHRTRAPDEVDPRVDDDGEEQDVDRVLPAKAGEDLHQAPTTASATRTTSRMAPTSCTRTSRAPLATASATAAAVPWSRSPVGRSPRSWPMKPLRDTPTSTG